MLRGVWSLRGGGVVLVVCLLFYVGRSADFGTDPREGERMAKGLSPLTCWTTNPCDQRSNLNPSPVGCQAPTHDDIFHNGAVSLTSWNNERGWNDGNIQLITCEPDEVCFTETDGAEWGAGGCIKKDNPIIQSLEGDCEDRFGGPAECEQHGCKNFDGISIAWCDNIRRDGGQSHACNHGVPRTCETVVKQKETRMVPILCQFAAKGFETGVPLENWLAGDETMTVTTTCTKKLAETHKHVQVPMSRTTEFMCSSSVEEHSEGEGFVVVGGCVPTEGSFLHAPDQGPNGCANIGNTPDGIMGTINWCSDDVCNRDIAPLTCEEAGCKHEEPSCNLEQPKEAITCQANKPGLGSEVPIENWTSGDPSMTVRQTCPTISAVDGRPVSFGCHNVVTETREFHSDGACLDLDPAAGKWCPLNKKTNEVNCLLAEESGMSCRWNPPVDIGGGLSVIGGCFPLDGETENGTSILEQNPDQGLNGCSSANWSRSSVSWCEGDMCNAGAPVQCPGQGNRVTLKPEPPFPTEPTSAPAEPKLPVLCLVNAPGHEAGVSINSWVNWTGNFEPLKTVVQECPEVEGVEFVCHTVVFEDASLGVGQFVVGSCMERDHPMIVEADQGFNGCVEGQNGSAVSWCDPLDEKFARFFPAPPANVQAGQRPFTCNQTRPATLERASGWGVECPKPIVDATPAPTEPKVPVRCQVNAPGHEFGVPMHNWINGSIVKMGSTAMNTIQKCPEVEGVEWLCSTVVFEDALLGEGEFVIGECKAKQDRVIVEADQGSNGCVPGLSHQMWVGSAISWCDPLDEEVNVSRFACNQGLPATLEHASDWGLECAADWGLVEQRVLTKGGSGECVVAPVNKEECGKVVHEVFRLANVRVSKKAVKQISKAKLPKGCFIKKNLKKPQKSKIFFNTAGKTESGCGKKKLCVCGSGRDL